MELEKKDELKEQTQDNLNSEVKQEENKEKQDIELSEAIKEVDKKKKNIHQELIEKVENSKQKAQEVYDRYNQLDKELEEKSITLIRTENHILKTTISNSMELLKELKVEDLDDELEDIQEITLENKESLIDINYPSKGLVKSIFVALIGIFATIAVAFAVGAKLANIPLNAASILNLNNWNLISAKYAQLINLAQIPEIGYALIGGSALVIGLILGKIVSWIQKIKNVKYVNNLEEEVESFIARLESKNAQMQDLIEHLDHIKLVMEKYDIILQEQNAKIRRMLFIEQPQSVEDLQRASKAEVDKTLMLLDELLKLMKTPVNDDIEIKEESVNVLKQSNSVINEVIRKLYI